MATLYIVATPIGNLEDLTLRASRILSSVSVAACEDTRMSRKLFSHLGVTHPRLIAMKSHASVGVIRSICQALEEGNDVALMSDAGTPGVADPGAEVVRAVRETLPEVLIVPIPGASSVATALSISGFPADSYYFAGFPPHKKGRVSFFTDIAQREETVVLFESPHRLMKALESLAKDAPDRMLLVARELTKMFESAVLAPPQEHLKRILASDHGGKGGFVLVLAPLKK